MSQALRQLQETLGSEAWDNPDLSIFSESGPPPPPFPRHVLGEFWSKWCEDAAHGANAPFDYSVMGLLTVAASLIGNSRMVSTVRGGSWRESPIIWAALIGPPACGKTPALAPLIATVDDIEETLAAGFGAIQRRHEAKSEEAKLHREAWEKDAKRCVKDGYLVPDLPVEAQEPDLPMRPRVRIMDTTPEAAVEIAAGNPRGLLLVRDELAGWWRGFNRYGGDGERQFWLQAWNGGSYTVDRKKLGRPVTVHRLSISVLGGAQPDVLASMLEGERDGFAARFLFAYPEPVAGFRLAATSAGLERAAPALKRLHMLEMVRDGEAPSRPFVCFLDNDAALSFESFWDRRRREAACSSGLWGDWLGKGGGTVLRLALLLEHLWWCSDSLDSSDSPTEVSFAALAAAVEMFDSWAAPMAQRAFGAAAVTVEDRNAAALAKWLRRTGAKSFNARAARLGEGGPGGALRKPKAMNDACDRLVEAGLIRPAGKREGETKGRQSSDYEVNLRLTGRAN
jgi:hypothetical protein